MRKPSKKTLTTKLDNAWSKAVRLKAKNKCEVCGKSDGVLNAHHIVGRTNRNLRWDLKNGCSLCFRCHKGGTKSAHEDPLWFREWLEENRWEDFLYLYKEKNNIKKWDIEEMQEKLEELLNQL